MLVSIIIFISSNRRSTELSSLRSFDYCDRYSNCHQSSRLSSWKRRATKLDENRTLLLVILVTPAHLSLLQDGNPFIPDLLRQEAELSPPGQVFDVMAAVVDRIPHPRALTEGSRSMSRASPLNPSAEATIRDGSEGVSVAVLDSGSAAPSLWATQQDSRERETMTIQQRCTLTFKIPSSTCADVEAQKLARQSLASRMLQLPVANTVFQNGRTATLFAQRWILQQEYPSNALLVPQQKVWLRQQTLDLNGLTKETSVDHFLHSDMTPITPPRTIKAAIGNIIRKVSAGGSSEANVPASHELERAITTGIQNGSIPVQPAEVWALVQPRERAPHMGCEIVEVSPELDELHKALLSGCRLHKVLSGGGGWGEKQGLLALDPDSSYSPRQQAFQLGTADEQDTEAEKLQALGDVVKPGDVVTFYVHDPSSAHTNTLELWPYFVAHSSLAPLSLMFGSLPSTMDAMPDLLRTKTTPEESDCVILEGWFGMLSEQGMSLTVSIPDIINWSHTDTLLQSTFNRFGLVNVTTKLDAPYTFFTIRARSMASHSEEANHFDVRGHDQDCKATTNSQLNATSAAYARMSAANRATAKMRVWNGITQSLQGLPLNIPKIGAIPGRPFATYSHCYSQAGAGKSQETLFEAEAEAEAASLEGQLKDLQIPTVALDDLDDNSAVLAEKIAKLRPQLRALRPNPSKSEEPEARAPSGRRGLLRVVRSQKRQAPMKRSLVRYSQPGVTRYIPSKNSVTRSLVAADEKPQAKHGVEDQESRGGLKYSDQMTSQPLIRTHLSIVGPLGRYKEDGQRLPPPTDMLFRKVNAVLAENNASESQLEIRKSENSEAGEGIKTSRGPRKNASDPSPPIRFISDTETEDAHIEVLNKLNSNLSERSIEPDVEPIEIRRHLSSGQAPKLPSTVKRVRRIPGFNIFKHAVAEKMATTQEENLLIRKHGVGPRSEERPGYLSHSTSAPEIQGNVLSSPKDQARELHSKYNFTSLHEISPPTTQKPREQSFTIRKHKSDAKSPIFVNRAQARD